MPFEPTTFLGCLAKIDALEKYGWEGLVFKTLPLLLEAQYNLRYVDFVFYQNSEAVGSQIYVDADDPVYTYYDMFSAGGITVFNWDLMT